MPILISLLGALAVALMILWRLNQAATAARGVGEAAEDLRGAWRRWSWRRKSRVDQIREVDDPRIAATIMMVAVAEYDGALTDAEHQTMRRQICTKFGASEALADELIAHARWLNRNGGDIGSLFLKLKPVVEAKCAPRERSELIEMLRQVDGVSGRSAITAGQISSLAKQLRVA